MSEQNKQDIIKLLEGSRDAIVCSIDKNEFPNAKTLFRRKNEGLDVFWFSDQWGRFSKAEHAFDKLLYRTQVLWYHMEKTYWS